MIHSDETEMQGKNAHSTDPVGYAVTAGATAADDEIIAAALRILTARISAGPALTSPALVKDYLTVHAAKHPEHEVFSVVFLNSQNELIEHREMFRGTINQTSVYPREVVKACLQVNAAAVILTHNHPSGTTDPSAADRLLTETLKKALDLIDVRVLDLIITAGGRSSSMAEAGLV